MKEALTNLLQRRDLTQEQAAEVLRGLIAPGVSPSHIAAVLVALRAKGESPAELAGFAAAMRGAAVDPKLPREPGVPVIDIVGTGGDGAQTLNISTAAAIVVAATGRARVAKHGNRAITSACGSADVLAALGLPMPLGPSAARRLFETTGFTFLFAPHYHRATAQVQSVRRELAGVGVRTIFNMLGPLTSPARPDAMLIGAFSLDAARMMHHAAALLGTQAQVVCSQTQTGFVDEITTAGPFCEVIDTDDEDQPTAYLTHEPEDMGFSRCTSADLRGADAAFNARAIREALSGRESPFLDSVLLTSTHALGLAGVPHWRDALAIAREAVASGAAARMIDTFGSMRTELDALNAQETLP